MLKFKDKEEQTAWDRYVAGAVAGFNAYGFQGEQADQVLDRDDCIAYALEQADSLVFARRSRE
jgi:hypothetical protein